MNDKNVLKKQINDDLCYLSEIANMYPNSSFQLVLIEFYRQWVSHVLVEYVI